MVTVTSGKNWKGEDCSFYMNILLEREFKKVKEVVSKKDFDYICIVAGLPGMGKSNFAMNGCKYFDPNFGINNICMTAQEFIEKTLTLPKKSAIMLDESFASMNSKVNSSRNFLRILNHLQLIRQRNLYVFLCLPNFFDLGKSIAIYRSMHLFVCYGEQFGHRGDFAAFGRDAKRNLYIKGLKFLNYHAQKPNFRGKFYQQKAVSEEEYDRKKYNHLMEVDKQIAKSEKQTKTTRSRDKIAYAFISKRISEGLNQTQAINELCNIANVDYGTAFRSYKTGMSLLTGETRVNDEKQALTLLFPLQNP
jgi:hypothetical protein